MELTFSGQALGAELLFKGVGVASGLWIKEFESVRWDTSIDTHFCAAISAVDVPHSVLRQAASLPRLNASSQRRFAGSEGKKRRNK